MKNQENDPFKEEGIEQARVERARDPMQNEMREAAVFDDMIEQAIESENVRERLIQLLAYTQDRMQCMLGMRGLYYLSVVEAQIEQKFFDDAWTALDQYHFQNVIALRCAYREFASALEEDGQYEAAMRAYKKILEFIPTEPCPADWESGDMDMTQEKIDQLRKPPEERIAALRKKIAEESEQK